MNAKAREIDLMLVKANHEKTLAALRRDVLAEIFAELVRIHHSGRTASASLSPEHISIYVHEKDDCANCAMFTAYLDSADELIALLEKLEHVTDPVYDLEEEVTTDVEAI